MSTDVLVKKACNIFSNKMETRSHDNETEQEKHTGPSGRDFPLATPIPCYSFNMSQKRALPEKVLSAIAATPETSLVRMQSVEVPARSSAAVRVEAGNIIRITLPAGPQVVDINVWNADNPKERFYSAKTRQIHTSHLTTGDSLWSCMPYLRPLVTLTADSVDYGYDDEGAGVHDTIGSAYDPYTHAVITGEAVHDTSYSGLVRAAVSQGLAVADVHDAFSAFKCSGFSKDKGVYFVKASPSRKSDYIDLFAHVNVIIAASASRQGDFATSCGDTTAEPTCFPVDVEVFQIPMQALEGWSTPKVSSYSGGHGVPA